MIYDPELLRLCDVTVFQFDVRTKFPVFVAALELGMAAVQGATQSLHDSIVCVLSPTGPIIAVEKEKEQDGHNSTHAHSAKNDSDSSSEDLRSGCRLFHLVGIITYLLRSLSQILRTLSRFLLFACLLVQVKFDRLLRERGCISRLLQRAAWMGDLLSP